MNQRERDQAILNVAVEAMLDYLDDAYPDGELGVVALVCEVGCEQRVGLPLWCSDERPFVQYGLLTAAAREALG